MAEMNAHTPGKQGRRKSLTKLAGSAKVAVVDISRLTQAELVHMSRPRGTY